MPAGYFTATGAGVGRVAAQVVGVPVGEFELIKYKLRASALIGATTVAVHYFTRVTNMPTPPLGWIGRPGNVDPATIDQLNLAVAKTGISLTASATAVSDSTAATNRIVCNGELWVIVDATVAAGAWTVIGSVDTVDLSVM